MIRTIPRRLIATSVLILAATSVDRVAAATPAEAVEGDTWQTTSQVSMEGMPPQMQMPVSKLQVCSKRDRTEPPGTTAAQRNCTNSNMQRHNDTVTWEEKCTGPDMSGTGEIVYANENSYAGSIKFASAQGNMSIKLTGEKLPGSCPNPQ